MFREYTARDPVFVIIDVRAGVKEIPTIAYTACDQVQTEGGKEIQRVFQHLPCVIEAEESEEVGVEHLLRDINDPSTSTLAMHIKQKLDGLGGIAGRLEDIKVYLQRVIDGKLPRNNQILYNLQNIFSLLPNLNVEELVRSMLVKSNDMCLAIYLSSLVRSVIALHSLLNSKIEFKDVDSVLDRRAGVEQQSKEAAAPATKDDAVVPVDDAAKKDSDSKMEE